jgi:hypothetical protein
LQTKGFIVTSLSSRNLYRKIKPPVLWERDIAAKVPNKRAFATSLLGGFFVLRFNLSFTNFSLGDASAFALIVLSLSANPKFSSRVNTTFATASTLVMIFLCAETFANDQSFVKRAARITIMLILAGFIGSGRIDPVALVRGMGIGVTLNTLLYYLHVTPDPYPGCLTGFLWDKNVAGLYYSVITVLWMAMVRYDWQRLLILLIGVVEIYLTLSRTSLVGLAFGLLWLLVSRRSGIMLKIAFAGAVYFAYGFLQDRFQHIGIFADRIGSDLLRMRIDAAT